MVSNTCWVEIYLDRLLLNEKANQMTQNLLDNVEVTCRSKLAKLVQIGNPRWPSLPPS